ncbi:MAG: hypothetical protein IPP91_19760 [Betaproteobacteria bacterium]|nr:hypothetical protein [Betaproteobacteria bacterium]
MAMRIEPQKIGLLRTTPRLEQILRVLVRHGFAGVLFGRKCWPPPRKVRMAFEELGLVLLKLGQVIAMRHDLLPIAFIDELGLLHVELPAMNVETALDLRRLTIPY